MTQGTRNTAKRPTRGRDVVSLGGGKARRRRCNNCDQPFVVTRDWSKFCCEACRKEFYRNGGISIRRLMPPILAQLEQTVIAPLRRRITELEAGAKAERS